MDYALCVELSTEESNRLIFQLNPANPERGLKRNRRKAATQEAKDMCNKCLVRKPCLEDALEHPDQAEYGIRGGANSRRAQGNTEKRQSRNRCGATICRLKEILSRCLRFVVISATILRNITKDSGDLYKKQI